MPTQTSLTNTTLQGADTVLRYDSYGNADQTTTYTGYSTRTNTNGTVTYSAPTGTARTTTTVYDGSFHLFPISSTNAATHGQSAGYDYRLGTLTSVTDANGNVTSAGYDSFGRMISLVKPGDTAAAPTNQFYYADGEIPFRYEVVQREVAGNNAAYRPIEHFYDGLGREIQTKQESKDWSQHIVTDTRYDGFGHVVAQSQPRYIDDATSGFWFYVNPGTGTLFRPTTSTYDALGRVRTSTAPDGSVTTLSYGVDGDGRWSQTIDANSHATRRYSDALGRMTQVREYNGTATPRTLAASTFYQYDALDRLNRVTDANGNVTTMGYDSLSRKTSMVDPDMGTWSYDYYANGSLKWQLDAKNQKLWFGYDALDRLTTTWRDGSWQPLTTYAYDAAAVPNSKGRRTSAATHTTTGDTQTFQTWTYDQRGRVKSMGQSA